MALHSVPPNGVHGSIVADSTESAKAAGLRYVTDSGPGIRRKRAGKGFTYIGADGKAIRNSEELRRIRSLAIPPAWSNVWICPSSQGHIQATGRDAKGRKQFRYHARWREVRDETKYGRLLGFGEALPAIRARVENDLTLPGLPRDKVLATVVRLLESTLIRVGNEAYARANGSYGLTTLRSKHVDISGSTLRFQFRSKSGKDLSIAIDDRRLAQIVKRCQELPGHELFQYLDDDGQRQSIGSGDVNTYLHQITQQDFTAKDFRTWAGTVLAASGLRACGPCRSSTQAKRQVVHALKHVAERLGNTPAICRKCYVHPAIIDGYLTGSLVEALERPTARGNGKARSLSAEEIGLLTVLRRQSVKSAQPPRPTGRWRNGGMGSRRRSGPKRVQRRGDTLRETHARLAPMQSKMASLVRHTLLRCPSS